MVINEELNPCSFEFEKNVKNLQLETLLECHLDTEELDINNQWFCGKCKEYRKAKIEKTITKFP